MAPCAEWPVAPVLVNTEERQYILDILRVIILATCIYLGLQSSRWVGWTKLVWTQADAAAAACMRPHHCTVTSLQEVQTCRQDDKTEERRAVSQLLADPSGRSQWAHCP